MLCISKCHPRLLDFDHRHVFGLVSYTRLSSDLGQESEVVTHLLVVMVIGVDVVVKLLVSHILFVTQLTVEL